ncbi:MAG: hypothetical protein KDH90_17705, partial [Anaerolineae bacterium]|nr:hypothetical protein [Anaerolineae bacterium]
MTSFTDHASSSDLRCRLEGDAFSVAFEMRTGVSASAAMALWISCCAMSPRDQSVAAQRLGLETFSEAGDQRPA